MSTADHLLLILHVGFAIFTLGPLTVATMSTPRYIRAGNAVVLRYLALTTRIYGLGSLGVFLFGLFLAQGKFDQFWLSASMTLFVVALVMLLILERDQRKVLSALDGVIGERAAERIAEKAPDQKPDTTLDKPGQKPSEEPVQPRRTETTLDTQGEQSRIAALSGIVAVIWLVILILMLWH
ncbi:MAG: hypothetical protein ABIS86_17240 [Streptosporangiaceae bacterium]